MRISDFIAGRLVDRGISHVFGVGGANIEDMFAAIQRRRPNIRMVLSKHEHAAGTAADAYARLTTGLGVVFVTSGGGAMNLVHSLAEARASAVPLLAIVGEPPTELQGAGAFQDTSGRGGAVDAAHVFEAVSTWCKRLEQVEQLQALLSEALHAALGARPGPAVLLLAKNLQNAELPSSCSTSTFVPFEPDLPDRESIECAAALLRAGSVLIIAGDEVARANAQPELATLAEQLDAKVAVTPEARDAFDNYSARFLGVSGMMGSTNVARFLSQSTSCLLVGTSLPVLARQGLETLLSDRSLISLGRRRPYLSTDRGLHLGQMSRRALRALGERLATGFGRPNAKPEPKDDSSSLSDFPLTSRNALHIIESALSADSVVIVDAGNTGAAAVHNLRIPVGARWLLAMGMAGMGYSFGAAVGAALATKRRCFVLAGDGAFFMNGLDIHTAVEHELPITYIVFDNRAHGMCLVRERLLLHENAGYNSFRRSHVGAGSSAMFPTLTAFDCRTSAALSRALEQAAERSNGPSLISIEFDHVEIPPFAAFQQLSRGISTISRGASDEND